MKKNISRSKLLLYFFLPSLPAISQTVTPVVKATLPAVLNESSGLEVINRNSFWSHNDGGGNAEIYQFDSSGTLLRTLTILGSTNVDWEDIARDTSGNIFIGDFGNNNNDRQNLIIYSIPDPASLTSDSIVPSAINFSYPDQTAFPPADPFKNFDCEAMIAYEDSLYLFSKDNSNPYSGYTKLYRLPKTPGTYVANLVDSFYTGPGPALAYSITSADISNDGSRLALLGYNKIWIFYNFTGTDFFSGSVQLLNISSVTQKEGICFLNNQEIYLTDELAFGIGQKLYYLNLTPYITSLHGHGNSAFPLTIRPNKLGSDQFEFVISNDILHNGDATITDSTGKIVYRNRNLKPGLNTVKVPGISKGSYIVSVITAGKRYIATLIKL